MGIIYEKGVPLSKITPVFVGVRFAELESLTTSEELRADNKSCVPLIDESGLLGFVKSDV